MTSTTAAEQAIDASSPSQKHEPSRSGDPTEVTGPTAPPLVDAISSAEPLVVVEEPELALVGPEDAMPAEAMPADECSVVRFRQRTKFKSESSATKRSAGAELGAAAKKLRGGAGVEGQIRTVFSTSHDPRYDPDEWREVYREGHGWVRVEDAER